jgi:protein Tob/BTG
MGDENKCDEYVPDPAMKAEIEAAVGFLTDFLVKAQKFEFSQESVDLFRRSLQSLLYRHYNGHWNSANPLKGSAFRCLRINGMLDPLVKRAAEASRLPLRKVRQAFPAELTVWVDPGDVSVRFGEEGSIGAWYASRGEDSGASYCASQEGKSKEQGFYQQQRGSPPLSSTPPYQSYQHAHQYRVQYQHASPVQYQQRQQSSPVWHPQWSQQRSSPSCGFVTALSNQQQQMQQRTGRVTPIGLRSNSPGWRASPQPTEIITSSTPTEHGEEQRCKMLAERLMRENLNLMASLAPGLVSSRAQPVGVGVN